MNRKLQERINELSKDINNFRSLNTYYKALCNFVKSNKDIIKPEQISIRLKLLLSLNLDDYSLEEINGNGLDLSMEKEKFVNYEYNTIEELLSSITETLWDIITISSDEECPNCKYGDLRYLKINYKENKGKIIMECQDCGQGFYEDGSLVSEKIIDYLPASKKDIENL